ncbi:hypothetical protein B7435_30045 [Mycolicibacterium peregrinum]|uniref:Uncharacterized protein n=1 Tax=Mycolicibacterium alvei TaxID=67081 RepID=A0A6N4V1D1_9MYCO|nr:MULTISPECIES: DUF6166 domain-containing protein [Mycolicibacterium]MCV7003543.1 hypothetical protein [Mycolicibacterium alvei]OWL95531.1 hypothetical protein B7435_30045 [Mycolicibacterium peregrinum]BBX30499.1 hypothetical protein MALV_56240 [Mycolicibacterium alvei]
MVDLVYRGYGLESAAGPRLVTIEDDSGCIAPLPHHPLHGEDGFSWGYGGSGPADLARSLIIHALGNSALCTTCRGTAVILHAKVIADQPEPTPCTRCHHGYTVSMDLYQQFKADVIAHLPLTGWTLSHDAVMRWLSQQAGPLGAFDDLTA